MPKGVEYQIVFNQAEFIKMAIDDAAFGYRRRLLPSWSCSFSCAI